MNFQIGDVVVCPDKQKTGNGELKKGTIWNIVGNEVFVLDDSGILHQANFNEIYKCQEYYKNDQEEVKE